jgi:hypothetical protein
MLRLAALALVSTSCTPAQAPIARKTGAVFAIGGVAGLVTSGVIAKASDIDMTYVSIGAALVSLAGMAVFAVGDLSGHPTGTAVAAADEPDGATKHRWAQTWLDRAQEAARRGDCERVQSIEPRIRRLDAELHDVVFMRDPDIVKCLHATEPEAPSRAAPVTPDGR